MAKKTRNSPIYDLTLLDKGIESTKPLGEFPKKVQIDLKKGHHVAEVSPDYVIVWGNPDWMKSAAYTYKNIVFNVLDWDDTLKTEQLLDEYRYTDERNLRIITTGIDDESGEFVEWLRGKAVPRRPAKFETDDYYLSLAEAGHAVDRVLKERGGITVKEAKDNTFINSYINRYKQKARMHMPYITPITDASVRKFLKSRGLVWDRSKRLYVKEERRVIRVEM